MNASKSKDWIAEMAKHSDEIKGWLTSSDGQNMIKETIKKTELEISRRDRPIHINDELMRKPFTI